MSLMGLGLERGGVSMSRIHKQLDPTQTGFEAEKLFTDLHKRIIGQNEAIDQIVNIYQTYLAGMTSPGRPIGNFLFLGTDRIGQNADGGGDGGERWWEIRVR